MESAGMVKYQKFWRRLESQKPEPSLTMLPPMCMEKLPWATTYSPKDFDMRLEEQKYTGT